SSTHVSIPLDGSSLRCALLRSRDTPPAAATRLWWSVPPYPEEALRAGKCLTGVKRSEASHPGKYLPVRGAV
ncbi:MAG: hypothetical protein WB812_00685, partial [Woeseiaceae bacterium]